MTLIRALYTHIREEVGTSSQGFSSDESISSISQEAFAPLHTQIKVINDDINRGIIKEYVKEQMKEQASNIIANFRRTYQLSLLPFSVNDIESIRKRFDQKI